MRYPFVYGTKLQQTDSSSLTEGSEIGEPETPGTDKYPVVMVVEWTRYRCCRTESTFSIVCHGCVACPGETPV